MKKIVTTTLGVLLRRVVDRLELPRGTRIAVMHGHRSLRADLRFSREALPKVDEISLDEDRTMSDVIDELVRNKLPSKLRAKAKFLIYEPGSRKPSSGAIRLRTARDWGDGHTRKGGENFDSYVESAIEKLADVWHEVVEDIGEDQIFLWAVCYFYDSPKQMNSIIEKCFASRKLP